MNHKIIANILIQIFILITSQLIKTITQIVLKTATNKFKLITKIVKIATIFV